MQRTPWTSKPSKGSLPSDRIKPIAASTTSKNNNNKKQQPSPKSSREIQRLESLIQAIRDYSTAHEKNPKGGCFCLARTHPLSPYTPICRSCGLIICSLNLPQYCCPHCMKDLMTAAQRESTIEQIGLQLASTRAQEAEQKQRALEEAAKLVGAFPSLPGSPAPNKSTMFSPARTLSLKQNNKVVVSYTPVLPISNTVELEGEPPDRIPPPPSEPLFSRVLPTPDRPWENLIKGASTYVPKHRLDDDTHQPPSRGKRNKGKMGESHNG